MWLVVKGALDKLKGSMYFKSKRLKRILDILEKLGVASLAVGFFQEDKGPTVAAMCLGFGCIILSIALTMEDE